MSKKKKVAYLAQKDVKLRLRYFYAHKNLKKRLFSSQMFLCAQKSQKAQDVKRFFFLDVLWCLCAFCALLLHRRFYAGLRLFLFLFAYVLFMLALRLSFLFAYVLFMLFMPNKRLSSSQTFLCAFKTVFTFICLCAFYACRIFS